MRKVRLSMLFRFLAMLVLSIAQFSTQDRLLSLLEGKWVALFAPLVSIPYILLAIGKGEMIKAPIFIFLMSVLGYVTAFQYDLRSGFMTGYFGTLLIYLFLDEKNMEK